MSTLSEAPFLELQSISKHFGGITALDNVDFRCDTSSIHAILGENGAGKSTLLKILCGVHQPDSGHIRLEGAEVSFSSPQEAMTKGIICVFQELSLVPDLSVADNICITDPPRRWGVINGRAQRQKAEELLANVGCEDINPISLVKDLSLSRRQMVEIAKALGRHPKLLLLDEATSALGSSEVEKLFEILRKLRTDGLAIIYISHRMHEIEQLPDTCSVFRNGQHVETFSNGSQTHAQIVQMMLGREITQVYPPKPQRNQSPPPMLEVEGLSWEERLKEISFTLGQGEILGIGGLAGQGQSELLLGLFGVLRGLQGTVKIQGQPAHISSPRIAKKPHNGLALIPEDRKTEGLLLPLSIAANIPLASYDNVTRGIVINRD